LDYDGKNDTHDYIFQNKMSVTTEELKFQAPQFKRFKQTLQLGEVTLTSLLKNVEITQFRDGTSSVYHFVHYKVYEDIDTYWHQFRGIIVKDYDRIVCNSTSMTPVVTLPLGESIANLLTTDKKGSKSIKLTETRENGDTKSHTIFLNENSYHIRPSFQGTIVRIWLSNGVLHKSSLRRPSIVNAHWIRPEPNGIDDNITFSEKFESLCGYGKETLFEPGARNSPFCHIFLMCSPQVNSYSHIDCGQGYVIYLETVQCYDPTEEEGEEQESFFLSDIPTKPFLFTQADVEDGVLTQEELDQGYLLTEEIDRRKQLPKNEQERLREVYSARTEGRGALTETDIKNGFLSREEADHGVKQQRDRYVFPLGQTTLSPDETDNPWPRFIPPPSDANFLETQAAVYSVSDSMTIKEADKFLRDGVDITTSSETMKTMKKKYPMFLPGEALFITTKDKSGDIKTFIVNPVCVNYRTAMIRDSNSRQHQLIMLRELAIARTTVPTNKQFVGVIDDMEGAVFEDVCQSFEHKDGSKYYFGISNDELPPPPPTNSFYDLLSPPEGTMAYDYDDIHSKAQTPGLPERQTFGNTRWFILAYYYCLCMMPSRRASGWESFQQAYEWYTDTMNFIVKNYSLIIDDGSHLYKTKAFSIQKKSSKPEKTGLYRMKKLIETAMTAKSSSSIAKEPEVLPDKEMAPEEKSSDKPDKAVKTASASYATTLKAPAKETNPATIARNIRNLFRKEESTSLYRMMKLFKDYRAESKK
jgi:hypothetical protein